MCVRGGKRLGHCAEHRIVATDAGSVLIIVLLCVTHLVKLRLWREGERGTKKHREVVNSSIHRHRDKVYIGEYAEPY